LIKTDLDADLIAFRLNVITQQKKRIDNRNLNESQKLIDKFKIGAQADRRNVTKQTNPFHQDLFLADRKVYVLNSSCRTCYKSGTFQAERAAKTGNNVYTQ